MMTFTVFNIGVQLAPPGWVQARSLAAYRTALSGEMAIVAGTEPPHRRRHP
ncbi:MFS transporter [Bradyrhizobium sp. 150]|nr:MFS transporter [Bradyrhizobium sp. 150]